MAPSVITRICQPSVEVVALNVVALGLIDLGNDAAVARQAELVKVADLEVVSRRGTACYR